MYYFMYGALTHSALPPTVKCWRKPALLTTKKKSHGQEQTASPVQSRPAARRPATQLAHPRARCCTILSCDPWRGAEPDGEAVQEGSRPEQSLRGTRPTSAVHLRTPSCRGCAPSSRRRQSVPMPPSRMASQSRSRAVAARCDAYVMCATFRVDSTHGSAGVLSVCVCPCALARLVALNG